MEKLDRKEFIDLLKRMLALDQEQRITPNEALSHPFITISHLIDYPHSLRYACAMLLLQLSCNYFVTRSG